MIPPGLARKAATGVSAPSARTSPDPARLRTNPPATFDGSRLIGACVFVPHPHMIRHDIKACVAGGRGHKPHGTPAFTARPACHTPAIVATQSMSKAAAPAPRLHIRPPIPVALPNHSRASLFAHVIRRHAPAGMGLCRFWHLPPPPRHSISPPLPVLGHQRATLPQ